MKNNPEKTFQYSVALILGFTAAAKLFSASGAAHLLDFPDPLIGFSNRATLMLIASVELAIAACLLSRLRAPLKHLLVGWLSANFLLYRLALALLKPGHYCKCLGTLTDKLHLNDQMIGYVLTGIALYLFIGSMSFYLRQSDALLVHKLRAGNTG